ncbi:MAG: TRAP transporter large permease subunit [Gammaproteobacteria bacterium]|nr:TRAP transporter large permease subunit [Gammaproteobacteria bacterium]
MLELLPLLLFIIVCLFLMTGYPVALTLAGVSLLFAAIGQLAGVFDTAFITLIPNRIFGVLVNQNLFAVPLFVFMGTMLEKSRIAEDLLKNMELVFGRLPGGLGIAVILVGMLLAASTGIVGATVVTMGILSLPTMLKAGYRPSLACGTLCATGTLGQIIPPSICLVLLGEVISNAYQQSQLNAGVFAPDFVSIGDLFAGAIMPGLLLVVAYACYVLIVATVRPMDAPSVEDMAADISSSELAAALFKGLLPPVLLMVAVLGSILLGVATPTEAASVGAVGAMLLALSRGKLDWKIMHEVCLDTTRITSMIYLILIGATIFSSIFRGFGGEELIENLLTGLPGGVVSATIIVMLLIFLLGFILDFIEITFMVVPLVGPVLLGMGLDPIWLGVMIAINLQTSFLTPPFGFSLFYLRSVAPSEVVTSDLYRGVIPFVGLQLLLLLLLAFQPGLATWLPSILNQ